VFMKEQLKISHFIYIVYCTIVGCNMVVYPIILILLSVPVRKE